MKQKVITGKEYARLKQRHKYNASPVYDEEGNFFASKKEYNRWGELLLLSEAGMIKSLKRQVTYELIVNKTLICGYRPDFYYYERGVETVEDVKGFKTPVYILKAKLFQVLYPTIRFIEL